MSYFDGGGPIRRQDPVTTTTPEHDAPGDEQEQREEDTKAAHRLRNGLISLVLLLAIVGGLLLAVPGLHGVADTVTDMKSGWVVAACGLEILSCLGYVLAFLQVFERAPLRFGARVALTELAFNSAVSLGGAGSVAVGAWLLIERGAPKDRVAQRSVVLFLLTSAINVITLMLSGFALWVGILPGPRNPLLSLLPGLVGLAGLLFFLALPRLMERGLFGRHLPQKVRVALETTASSIRDTRQLLARPDWRIIGAIAYLWCDILVLVACFAAAGYAPEISAVMLAYQIAYISNILPVPGGIGVLDGSMVGALVLYGVRATPAAAATLVYHAISLWIPAVWGTVAFVLLRRHRGEPLNLRPPRPRRRRAAA
jgi:uncharacterized membrane protein YbhN (UPF0104 family)